jgi:peptidoglycan hydrolase-like protein with peptidoglycan-binding domain
MMTPRHVVKFYDFEPNKFQKFGAERDGGARRHRGTDLSHANHSGTLVPALLGGTVIGVLADGPTHGFGNQVTTRVKLAGRKYRVSYAHGTKLSPYRKGDKIDQGDYLSTEGETGAAVGPCVHVEVFDVEADKFIDPMILIHKVLAKGPSPASVGSGHPPTVRLGNRGPTVTKLKGVLIARNHPMTANALYDRRTLHVVRVVQERRSLVVDGICGPKTWKALGQ